MLFPTSNQVTQMDMLEMAENAQPAYTYLEWAK